MARPRSPNADRLTKSIRIDPENAKWLKLHAAHTGETLSDTVNRCIASERINSPLIITEGK
jgi:macrodomain Ter protein organizer (MatP/YcbG family)